MWKVLAAATVVTAAGCHRPDFNPALARAAYPYDLHSTDTIPIEVFRDGTTISIVNSTASGWHDAIIWINQRFSAPLPSLRAGQTLQMELSAFRDDIGESFPAGGMWATRRSMPVRLVELQGAADQPLVGIIAIRQTEHQ
ncbi:MAG: hypothetical protein QF733_03140 [Phycisphaerales bacterium]|jgi:hypothetical protein|nr:hypothetical protein [Phycisphaerales bacterium]